MPPRPTAENCNGSPTNATRQPFTSANLASSNSFAVEVMPASSTITVAPGGRSKRTPGGRARRCSINSLSSVSATSPVSPANTSAAVADGATPNTTRPAARISATAGANAVVFPVPAGPTTITMSASPATAPATAAWATSNSLVLRSAAPGASLPSRARRRSTHSISARS